MDEQKKTSGRDSGQAAPGPGGRRSRRAEPIGSMPKEHLAEPNGRRRRDEETDAKMRLLWALLGVLVVLLVAAIVYEIILGNGIKETGSQRMNGSVQETEQSAGSDEETETEDVVIILDSDSQSVAETEEESASGQETELIGDTGTDLESGSEEVSAQEAQDSDTTQETDVQAEASASQDVTLAGLGN